MSSERRKGIHSPHLKVFPPHCLQQISRLYRYITHVYSYYLRYQEGAQHNMIQDKRLFTIVSFSFCPPRNIHYKFCQTTLFSIIFHPLRSSFYFFMNKHSVERDAYWDLPVHPFVLVGHDRLETVL